MKYYILSIKIHVKLNKKDIVFRPDLKLWLIVVLPKLHGLDKGVNPNLTSEKQVVNH